MGVRKLIVYATRNRFCLLYVTLVNLPELGGQYCPETP